MLTVGTHYSRLGEAILMSTHNIGFYKEIVKLFFNFIKYSSLSSLLYLSMVAVNWFTIGSSDVISLFLST